MGICIYDTGACTDWDYGADIIIYVYTIYKYVQTYTNIKIYKCIYMQCFGLIFIKYFTAATVRAEYLIKEKSSLFNN